MVVFTMYKLLRDLSLVGWSRMRVSVFVQDDHFGGLGIVEIDFVFAVHGKLIGVDHFACA